MPDTVRIQGVFIILYHRIDPIRYRYADQTGMPL